MNGVHAIRSVLVADAALTNLVPASKIAAGVLPQGTAAPFITLQSISSFDRNIPAPGAKRFVTERVQVSVVAKTYDQQQIIMAAVKKAAADKINPTVPGISNATIHTDSKGPDGINDDASLYIGSQDFRVKYSETT